MNDETYFFLLMALIIFLALGAIWWNVKEDDKKDRQRATNICQAVRAQHNLEENSNVYYTGKRKCYTCGDFDGIEVCP